ncbi:MAG TPA: lytic murein transglycosylase [Mycobacteriales bacterium]|jgi:membrane-bound lytic murein transglycosylase B|nr:lytic murein transglycosylase [Mycobacteriales bacterium]
MLALLRRARVLAALGAAGVAFTLTPAAHAESTGDAEAKARALLAQVQRLQQQVKQAEARYDASLAGVAASVNAAIQTDQTSSDVAAQTAAATDELDNRVRGLYMSGGPLALYVTALDSGDITDLQSRVITVSSLVSTSQDVVHADRAVAAKVRAMDRQAQAAAHRRIATERNVRGVATRVLTLLAQEQTLLAQAQAQVAHLKALDAARAALAAATSAFGSITTARLSSLGVLPPSPLYNAYYHAAAKTCPGLSWTVLAAIGQVESGHGRNPSMSSAGALGPMQFLPSTFAAYAVDGDHNGTLDIMAPGDAIYTAARYLCANGAGAGGQALYNAVWHYNHADWYVQMVLDLAQKYAA